MLTRPNAEEFAPYFAQYIAKVPDGDVIAFLRQQAQEVGTLAASISEEKGLLRYAPGKWSVKEVLWHITDTERIMAYRLLRVARGDTTILPGFDQDVFIENASFDSIPLSAWLQEWQAVRTSTFSLLPSIAESHWLRQGTASGRAVTARALAYIIAGHAQHHLDILKERYL
ncbi:DinB family protein [Paenibacillus whitsoniae]|uniref:DinB family protein n=1 Tax=Paenibacillus whitsoniae TaxID=2496558 RepID=A0A3S0ACF0_9BACL|nr:DinB family protein [Paenibacillus whitsoniae]RTE09752.1 DinB family protein [Paenibacillus whitsoniae]